MLIDQVGTGDGRRQVTSRVADVSQERVARDHRTWYGSVRERGGRGARGSGPEILILTLMAQCPSRLCVVGRGGLP